MDDSPGSPAHRRGPLSPAGVVAAVRIGLKESRSVIGRRAAAKPGEILEGPVLAPAGFTDGRGGRGGAIQNTRLVF